MRLGLVSAKGSPGVTTLALGVAAIMDGIAVESYVRQDQTLEVENVGMEFSVILKDIRKATELVDAGVAREVFALKRGITSIRESDDNTIASLVVALQARSRARSTEAQLEGLEGKLILLREHLKRLELQLGTLGVVAPRHGQVDDQGVPVQGLRAPRRCGSRPSRSRRRRCRFAPGRPVASRWYPVQRRPPRRRRRSR